MLRSPFRALCGALLLLSTLCAQVALAQQNAPSIRRFALIVGANQGGKGRAELRYAQRDAQAVAAVLEQLGGVDRKDRILLYEPSPEQLLLALTQLQTRIQGANGQRTELLFYYSGHSDERGLLLGEDRLAYRDLRDGLSSVKASVHVGVLDSCASGALTRLKGGERRAPFLLDHSNAVQGHAFITSSSADEGSQESDRVGASFFTHFLVSGLRGAADFSGDGRVTLNEAYRFAFDETLARTEDTNAGPQHASYDIQLVGTGDLVMTDLRTPAAALKLPKSLSGRMYLRDARGNLVVELNKPAGREVELALDAQAYQILLDQDGRLSRAGITLPANTTTELRLDQFVAIEGQKNRLRGDAVADDGRCRLMPFGVGIVPQVSTNARYKYARGPDGRPPCVRNNVGLHILWGQVDELEGASFAFGVDQVRDDMRGAQVALGMNLAGDMHGVQIAVGSNYLDTGRGAQFSVGPSIVGDQFIGVQGALINLAVETYGAQLGLVNGSLQHQGAQLGLVNLGGEWRGVQAGLVNVAAKKSTGFAAGLVNVTGADGSHGFQLGLVNVSAGPLRGGQVGLVNYAQRTDGQVGLLSITRDGGVHGLAFTSDAMPLQAGIRFDADHTFATLIAGLSPASGKDSYGFGFGFGGKIRLPHALWLEPGLDYQYLAVDGSFRGDPSTLQRGFLQLRYELRPHVSVFGGPLYEVVMHPSKKNHDRWLGYLDGSELGTSGKTQFLGSPGFMVGVSM